MEVEIGRSIPKDYGNYLMRYNSFKVTKNNFLLIEMDRAKMSLRSYLKQYNVNMLQINLLFNHLVKSVYLLHKMGYIHHDIAIQNIFIKENTIVLADYGLGEKVKENSDFIRDKKALLFLITDIQSLLAIRPSENAEVLRDRTFISS